LKPASNDRLSSHKLNTDIEKAPASLPRYGSVDLTNATGRNQDNVMPPLDYNGFNRDLAVLAGTQASTQNMALTQTLKPIENPYGVPIHHQRQNATQFSR